MQPDMSSLLPELRGVPKPVLRMVFGKALGGRIWKQQRQRAAASHADRHDEAAPVSDSEVVMGMIEYVSRRAGETLRERGRRARAIGLRIVYTDGVSRRERTRLARATNDVEEIGSAAIALFGGSKESHATVAAVDLTVTSVQAECASERVNGLAHATASAAAARA
jgi:hypothetical protein